MNFTYLSENDNKVISTFMIRIEIARGEVLFQPGDEAKGVYFLEKGRLGVQTKTGFEDRQQVVALLDPGAPIGERGFAFSDKRGMTVVAIEDSSVFFLSANDFSKIEASNPSVAIIILKKLLSAASLRLQASSERLAHVL